MRRRGNNPAVRNRSCGGRLRGIGGQERRAASGGQKFSGRKGRVLSVNEREMMERVRFVFLGGEWTDHWVECGDESTRHV
jgi:hypothetical protein